MNRISFLMLFILSLFNLQCQKDNIRFHTLEFTFDSDMEGWVGDFADYPIGAEEFYKLSLQHSFLPSPLNQENGAIEQSGKNRSDDLFMFIKRKVTNLIPNQEYELTFDIEFATNAADNSVGVGGSPASSVYIKAGATTVEPQKVIETSSNHYRMNIDKANQALSGKDMVVLGDFSNGIDEFTYALKTLRTSNPLSVRADENGELWLVIGTDSGFEATTTIYYNRISVQIE